MTARDVRKNFNLFVDGQGYAGQVNSVTPPKLTKKTEEFRGGGMNMPVKLGMGMEAMDADFSMIQFSKDVLSLFGLAEGQFVPLTLRENLESYDGTETPVTHVLRGQITEIDQGTVEAGTKPEIKVSMNLNYYRLQHGDTVVQEIDVINMIHIVDGVDVMATQRANLGM
ncbi:phage major tail tube protein [Bradyrhizobium sp. BWC-3-1]|uniref:phage major tail tube protein n=1 Tax=Bradyrhizobium sp. BWC-3-1 TaxID=3080012 RepID=UPI00293EE2B6|nr:phage major tail tube protein [Bradyrhizobium sp. BWC-3-1]WOH61896.1 phage major tail tube protein [Bradyrhizobium sp. BWC-3-1]